MFRQPKLHVTDFKGKDYGEYNVVALWWDEHGKIISAQIYFEKQMMIMSRKKKIDFFVDSHSKLRATIKFNNFLRKRKKPLWKIKIH
jgi:hypothetical protein